MSFARIIEKLERKYSAPAPKINERIYEEKLLSPFSDGTVIAIVGGGLAGTAFARRILTLSKENNKKPMVYLINSTGCNYCGGLITNLALETLGSLYKLDVSSNIILNRASECVFINNKGSIEINLITPMLTTLRTSRFQTMGFDDSLKDRVLEGIEDMESCLKIFEPTLVRRVIQLKENASAGKEYEKKWKVTLSLKNKEGNPEEIDAHVLVMATGFRSLEKPMLKAFQQQTGFIPPPLMDASVAEIDTSSARHNIIARRIFVIDGAVDKAVVAFIPKGPNWLTISVLGKRLTKEELDKVFEHPQVKKYIDLPRAAEHLRCRTICPAYVYTGSAKNFYGNSWVVLGDLTGYGRVLKDGFHASFWGAHLAAETIFYQGIAKKDFEKYYHKPLRSFEKDNYAGMVLYRLNDKLKKICWFNKVLINAGKNEKGILFRGEAIHAATRGLMTGMIPYRLIGILYIIGLLKYIFRHPLKTLIAVVNSFRRK